MLIDISGNPHSKQPHRDLWDKGWRLERKKDEVANSPKPRTYQRNAPGAFPHKVSNVPRTAPGQTNSPVVTDRLVQRFNNRHQTRS